MEVLAEAAHERLVFKIGVEQVVCDVPVGGVLALPDHLEIMERRFITDYELNMEVNNGE